MKNTPTTLLWVILTALLISACGPMVQLQNPQKYSESIIAPGVKPLHVGYPKTNIYGVYHVQIYKRSIVFMTTTKLIEPTQIEVFDLDFDNKLDVVYICSRNVWSVGFTNEFRSKNKTIEPTLSSKKRDFWLDVANRIRASYELKQSHKKLATINTKKAPQNQKVETDTTQTHNNQEWVAPPPIEFGKWVH
jgi:hypothetical protein